MRYVRFTDKQTGKPLWLREDQVLGCFPEKAHYRITPAFNEVDIEVRENGEEILAIMEGKNQDGIQADGGKPVKSGVRGEVPQVPQFGRGQRGV